MPAGAALDVVLSLLLDDGDAQSSRAEARQRVLALLDEPLDEAEAEEYRRERWGVEGEAARAVADTEQAVAGQAGDFGDVDLDELRAANA